MDYVKILRRAWQITWQHKELWLFGFLLALVSGGGGGGGGRGIQYTTGAGDWTEPPLILGAVFLLLLILLVLVVAGVILSHLSRGALIGMVREVEETGSTDVRSGWRTGWSRFLSLLAIDLIMGIPAAIVAVVLILLGLSPLALLLFERRALTVLGTILTVLLMLLVVGLLIVGGTVLSVVRQLACRQSVLEEKGALDSIRDGYHMGRVNLQNVGVLWLLVLVIDLATGVAAFPLFALVFAAAAVPALVIYGATEAVLPALMVGIPLGLLGILFSALVTGVYQVFRSAVWTLSYREL